MPWPRFAKILAAAIVEADPALAAERAARARVAQDVFSFDSEDGLKTIVAKAAAGDAVWFLATINRIAEILAVDGDTDPIGTRRARAVGILARPAEALRLLIEHQHEPADKQHDAAEPAESDEPGETAMPGEPSEPNEPNESAEPDEPADPIDVDATPGPEAEEPEPDPDRIQRPMITGRCRRHCRRALMPPRHGRESCCIFICPRPLWVPVMRWCGPQTAI